ncbi:TetR family transcriptional regulator [Nocardia sp. CDC159]|uniref:TetR family transcriptional regulator n=1 Tax=Nocardia pulmonis TaxID=2951408 RepID=A0A9X2E8S6_9NOCA|nr:MULTISPECIES: TetR/AcrR family transcriptional regulator [Nocardia]MCM6773836.1 TetR family transcriptional regulator [Nocardia pulmonis]MCM6786723.1 TetR family transcriptional regulator [Nocardia sp. CDC159]
MAGEHVLEAVLTVLAERGVEALSVRSVAAAARVSPAQVQYYYRTKTDLIRSGFAYAGARFLADVREAAPNTLRDIVFQWLPLDERRDRRARVWLAYAGLAAVDPVLARESASLDADLRAWYVDAGLTESEAVQLLALVDGLTLHCLVLPMAERKALVDEGIEPYAGLLGRSAGVGPR